MAINKYLVIAGLFVLLMVFVDCESSKEDSRALIQNFLSEAKAGNLTLVKKEFLVDYSPDFDEAIIFSLEHLRMELINSKNIEILSYEDFKSADRFDKYKILNPDTKLYCIVSDNALIAPIVLKDDKIAAFFTGIIKHKNRISVIYLSQLDNLD